MEEFKIMSYGRIVTPKRIEAENVKIVPLSLAEDFFCKFNVCKDDENGELYIIESFDEWSCADRFMTRNFDKHERLEITIVATERK